MPTWSESVSLLLSLQYSGFLKCFFTLAAFIDVYMITDDATRRKITMPRNAVMRSFDKLVHYHLIVVGRYRYGIRREEEMCYSYILAERIWDPFLLYNP